MCPGRRSIPRRRPRRKPQRVVQLGQGSGQQPSPLDAAVLDPLLGLLGPPLVEGLTGQVDNGIEALQPNLVELAS